MNRKWTKKWKNNNYYHLEDILNTVLKKSIKTETRLQLQESKLKINARNKFHHSSYLTCGGIFNLIPKIIYICLSTKNTIVPAKQHKTKLICVNLLVFDRCFRKSGCSELGLGQQRMCYNFFQQDVSLFLNTFKASYSLYTVAAHSWNFNQMWAGFHLLDSLSLMKRSSFFSTVFVNAFYNSLLLVFMLQLQQDINDC